MKQANADVRQYAKERKVLLWEVAQRYGCNDGNFTRKLRTELPEKEKAVLRKIIDQIAKTREE